MGAKSQAFGKIFEDVFLRTCRLNGVAITRIPDSCRTVGKKLIRVKSPWDFVLTYRGKTALIDTKTIDSTVYPYSLVTHHQVENLFNHERSGAISGYVIWLRKSHRVFFIPASALINGHQLSGSFSDIHPQAVYLGDDRFDIKPIFTKELHA